MGAAYTKAVDKSNTANQLFIATPDHVTSGGTATILLVIFITGLSLLLIWMGIRHLKSSFISRILQQQQQPAPSAMANSSDKMSQNRILESNENENSDSSHHTTSSKIPTTSESNEMSLADIGFNTEIPDWNEIIQPNKSGLLELLEKMIKNYEKPNFQIRIADMSFNCHLMVLQCYSDFFMKLNDEQVVDLPASEVTPEAFIMIYDWMLSANAIVQRDGILELLQAAEYLRIKQIIDQCWICIHDELRFTEDEAFLLYLEARKLGQEPIQKLMLTRIYKFFLTLVASKEFLELTPEEICLFLSSNTIGVNSETEVLMSAVRWLNFDWNAREKHLLEVMKCVRFCLMNPRQLLELKTNSDCDEIQRVVQVPEVKEMVNDALSYLTIKDMSPNNLHLEGSAERQWIRDSTLSKNFGCQNEMFNSYNTFLEYIDMIRNMGKEHWKTLERVEGKPNLLLLEAEFSEVGITGI